MVDQCCRSSLAVHLTASDGKLGDGLGMRLAFLPVSPPKCSLMNQLDFSSFPMFLSLTFLPLEMK